MKLRSGAIAAVVVGAALLNDCGGGGSQQAKDSEVRTYIRDELEPYLDSLAHQLCRIQNASAQPNVGPGNDICTQPTPDGYKKPPSNGAP